MFAGDWHMAYILLYAPKVLEETASNDAQKEVAN